MDGTITLHKHIDDTDPSCLQMYYYIEQYADSFEIPKNYAYGVAYAETRYKGPFHWTYDHKKTSTVGAVGPMQIMPTTAAWVEKVEKISVKKLKNDVEFNVMISMKYLRYLYDRYGDWQLVFGAYNTGRPMINKYAKMVYEYEPTWKIDEE
jgi:soluble lytic murein transglycosylase-like protein